jgi:DNA-directed RNA polymerase subunit RPC12/RpoP
VSLTRTRRLLCPKCGSSFDYEFIPGASFSAIRLGNSRYMRCPICQRFSVFKMTGPEATPTPEAVAPPPES